MKYIYLYILNGRHNKYYHYKECVTEKCIIIMLKFLISSRNLCKVV